jgi:hypothetical protein
MATRQTYQVQTSHVEDLLHVPSIAFEVPVFQRRYAWTTDEVDELMGDLYGDDDWWIEKDEVEPYFLGSIVLARTKGSHHVLLDGQQRLTTITLLLACLQHVLQEGGHAKAQELERYLLAGKFGEPMRPKIRLQPEDADVYRRLLQESSSRHEREIRRTALGRAVQRIHTGIEETLKRGGERSVPRTAVLERMVKRLVYEVELVRIEASTEAQAFRLFETLNDRGLPLNGADLIKNKLLSQAGHLVEPARLAWTAVTDEVRDNEILNFLRHFWIAFKAPVRKDRLYKEYLDELKDLRAEKVLAFAKELGAAAQVYDEITSPEPMDCSWGVETGEALQRLVLLRARSCRPLLLHCATHFSDQVPEVVALCEAASVRHTLVSGLNPNQLDKAYAAICKALRGGQKDVIATVLQELSRLVPTDEDFTAKFPSVEVSAVSAAWRAVLVRLNELISTGETRVAGTDKVHVEHVLPRNPSKAALVEAEIQADEVEEVASKIGNLTLLSGKKNQSISNLPFSQKRPAFLDSEIAFNRQIATCERWGKDEVLARGKQLAELATKAWFWPRAEVVKPGETSSPSGAVSVSSKKQEARRVRPQAKAGTLPNSSDAGESGRSADLPLLVGNPKVRNTVWLPRILWALEYARQTSLPPVNASEIARVLEDFGGLKVPGTNIARAFRDQSEDPEPALWDEVRDQRYVINKLGQRALREVLESMGVVVGT